MLFLMVGAALAYEPVDGISFKTIEPVEQFEFIDNTYLKIESYRQENSTYYDELFYKAIYSSTVASLREIQSLGALHDKCTKNDLLQIFEISEAELNNPNRFPSRFIGGRDTGRAPLWGYFDPRIDEPGYNSIVISPHDKSSNYRILVHEVAHHWYSTFCLENYTKLTSEEFATMIQDKAVWN